MPDHFHSDHISTQEASCRFFVAAGFAYDHTGQFLDLLINRWFSPAQFQCDLGNPTPLSNKILSRFFSSSVQ